MKLIALGGASEVGASCIFLEAGGHRILLDAGIRISSAAGDKLPDLAMLQELGGIEAVIASHAHMDHTGCLPVVIQSYPEVKIFCTQSTKALMQILFNDAIKIMGSRWDAEAEIPLYDEASVARMFARVFPISPGERVLPFGDSLELMLYPAGHILGASQVCLFTTEGDILYTGDFSVTPQRTVGSMSPPPVKPHLIISESTYGNRLHANREAEEKRLYEAVAKVVQEGGKALIPAFALGRAQEVILILQDAQRKGLIPSFPVWVDGMVKNICSAYSAFGDELPKKLQQKMKKGENPFFNEKGTAKTVIPPDREKILAGEPCAIVSSSGMLTGGPSVFYASELAKGEKNAIFLTGYQDEESPGRSLLNLIDCSEERFLTMNGVKHQVNCRVDRYSLSAHADSGQIMAMLSRFSPSDVVLVHGDAESRNQLGSAIADRLKTYLPDNGESLEFVYRRRMRARPRTGEGIGKGRRLDEEGLRELSELVAKSLSPGALRTPLEIASLWYGDNALEEALEEAKKLILGATTYFERDRRRPFLLRLKEPGEAKPASGMMEQNKTLREVEEIFRDAHDLYRKGLRAEGDEILLFFKFPSISAVEHAERIRMLEEKTGWKVIISQEVLMSAIDEVLRATLPASLSLQKAPSYFRDRGEVKIRVSNPEAVDLRDAGELFLRKTGLRLVIEEAQANKGVAIAFDAGGKMEQNAVFSLIEEAFASRPGALFRKSRKSLGTTGTDYIELSFISPEVGERYHQVLSELSQKTGWEMKINPEPNQNAIKQWVKSAIPPAWGLQKEPSFFKADIAVGVKLSSTPGKAEWEDLMRRCLDATGYRIKLL